LFHSSDSEMLGFLSAADSYSVGQGIPCWYGTQTFITMITKSH